MYVLNGEKIRVEYSDSGELSIFDLQYGGSWKASAPFRMTYGNFYSYNLASNCRTTVITEEKRMRFIFDNMVFFGRFIENPYRKPDPGPDFKFEFSIEIRNDSLLFRMEPTANLDEEPLKINFANGLFAIPSDDEGEAVLPCGYGGIFRLPRNDKFNFAARYADHYTSIPVFGLLRKQKPGLAIRLLDYTDQTTWFSINKTHPDAVAFDVEYDVVNGMANHVREMVVRITPPGDTYNELAKWYRSCLISEKKFVSYREKIARSPEAEKLVGSVIWKHSVYAKNTPHEHTYSLYIPRKDANEIEGLPNNWTAYEVFDTANKNGFDRVCIYNTGWNFMGFDSGYPTRLPPNPERGTPEEFRAAAEYGRSLSPDYIFSVHDNYIDTYRNSPEDCTADLVKLESGAICKGGIWRGGRAQILCTKNAEKYARRDIPKIVDIVGRGSIYSDVFGCNELRRCYDPAHPMTEQEDLKERKHVLGYLAEQFGSVTTEGGPVDYFADTVHLGAFCSIWPLCGSSTDLSEPPLPVPFWQLVYHDAILNYTCEGAYGPQGAAYQAFVALYNLLPTAFDAESLQFSKELRGTYTSEMISHEFIGEVRSYLDADGIPAMDGKVRTKYADGTMVEAEFTGRKQAKYKIYHS